jgi:histidine ammonia-lyase/phenylalanine ammonia-lyase
MMDTVIVDGASLRLEEVESVARRRAPVALTSDPAILERIRSSYQLNQRLLAGGTPIYGVTTGLGDSVDRHIGLDRAATLQANLVTYLGCGVGDYLPVEECRAILLARINCLAKGYSAVRLALIERLVELLNRDIVPCIPRIGSVGASGDLIPASYIAAVIMGQRAVYHRGRVRPTPEVYAEAGLAPMSLEPKEGLAMVNGTNFMTGVSILALEDAHRLAGIADACTAMATEVLTGITGPFEPFLHDVVKPHPGQIVSARRIRAVLEGSRLARSYDELVQEVGVIETGYRRVEAKIQDKYSIRCAPQCIGALYDAIAWARRILEVELNSSNDNPLYDIDTGTVRSGGDFSGFHVGLAMDTLKIAVASVADLLDRQFELINDEKYNMGLGMCCTNPLPETHPEAGTHHGFKGMQLAISAVTAEALNACAPMTVFSRSTACHSQDKVSMGAAAARQAREVVSLTQTVAAIHLLILCQAADLRGADRLGHGSRRVHAAIRAVSPFVERDRELRADIEQVVALIASGQLSRAIDGLTHAEAFGYAPGTNPT